jgi:hypothetical protein
MKLRHLFAPLAIMAASTLPVALPGEPSFAATTPSSGAFVIGPGCFNVNFNHDSWDTHGTWTQAGGDYTGSFLIGGGGSPNCSGVSYYTLDGATSTALFRWHFEVDTGLDGISCHMWAYIPTQNAGDHNARYDFYADDGSGGLQWIGWPGHTINQQTTSGWTDLGGVNVPPSTYLLTVILNNQDSKSPGWYAGAGDIAVACNG